MNERTSRKSLVKLLVLVGALCAAITLPGCFQPSATSSSAAAGSSASQDVTDAMTSSDASAQQDAAQSAAPAAKPSSKPSSQASSQDSSKSSQKNPEVAPEYGPVEGSEKEVQESSKQDAGQNAQESSQQDAGQDVQESSQQNAGEEVPIETEQDVAQDSAQSSAQEEQQAPEQDATQAEPQEPQQSDAQEEPQDAGQEAEAPAQKPSQDSSQEPTQDDTQDSAQGSQQAEADDPAQSSQQDAAIEPTQDATPAEPQEPQQDDTPAESQEQQQDPAQEPSQSSSQGAGQDDAQKSSQSSEQEAAAKSEPYGSPWQSSIFAGNLPAEAPSATDDLYLHYTYDYISAHQDGKFASAMSDAAGELRTAVTATIKDDAITTPGLDALRIFYNQAADLDTLKASGADELRPYLAAVQDTTSLDELEALLISPDFPFSPWINTSISAPDMTSKACVAISPNMMFSDITSGTNFYQDTTDKNIQEAYNAARAAKTAQVQQALELVSIAADSEQAVEITEKMFELEKAYGKEDFQEKYLSEEYGATYEARKFYTFDELAAACSNFPLRETLAKTGHDAGEGAIVMNPGWLSAFNSIWTEENFELLRQMTEAKVLLECAAFIDPAYFSSANGQADLTGDDVAWAACDQASTFGQLLASTYVDHTLGETAVEDLEKLTNDLIDTYIDLVDSTPWLNSESRENVMDKIDNLALNVLRPSGGYTDYSTLKLATTEEGGTLLNNYLTVKAFNEQQEVAQIGQPVSASTFWAYLSPTVGNCFYEPMSNSINIYPGFVNSLMYKKDMSDEELLAGIGFVIAHEISHAFDYQGSQFDAFGRSNPVFRGEDAQEFVALRDALAQHYSTIKVTDEWTVDGIATSVENAADIAGVQAIVERGGAIDGFDYERLFGLLASKWAEVHPPAYATILRIDEHPPANVRVNVSVQMQDAFHETFGTTEGDGMYVSPEERITIWGGEIAEEASEVESEIESEAEVAAEGEAAAEAA